MNDMLAGRRILVTGAARGLGFAFARRIVAAGAAVVLADILADKGRRAAEELRQKGYAARFEELDLAEPASIERCAAKAAASLGGLDGLVNNGAIATGIGGRTLEEIDIETWDRVMRVNARGVWLMTKAALPCLRRSAAARVVNIASDTALWGAPELMHYVAGKGAVIAMTRAMARELGKDNIAVNVVAPGLTRVEATESVAEERHRLYSDGRAIAREQLPEDVAGVVAFLLSDEAGFITGQTIPVNGGFVFN